MQVDPLLSLLVGALGAALLGLLGAWIQSRREHARWIREQRLAAYIEFLRVIETMPSLDTPSEDFVVHVAKVTEAQVTLMFLGPSTVAEAANQHDQALLEFSIAAAEAKDHVESEDEKEARQRRAREALEAELATRERFLASARAALGIRA